ncbi:hypothetical protein ACFQX7_38380 [Luedemannella flava]
MVSVPTARRNAAFIGPVPAVTPKRTLIVPVTVAPSATFSS